MSSNLFFIANVKTNAPIDTELTKRECAIRAAAIIDTDGSISISKQSKTYLLRCSVANNDLRIIEWLKETYGGSIHTLTNRRYNDGYKRQTHYQWSIPSQKAGIFLRQIYPFLIIKQNQAFCGMALRIRQGYHTRKISTHEKMIMWEQYYVRMKVLNSHKDSSDDREQPNPV